MGTPRPHVSRHVSGRAPRRGRRPRRPVFRSPIAGCTRVLHVCLRRPYFFQQRKKYGKERRQKPSVFGFPFRPIVTAVQKGSAPNRLHSYPHCRSCVPRENFLLSRRTEEVLYILHTFICCGPKGRTYLSQPAGKRHPLPRPAFERPQWAHSAHTYLAMSPVAHPVGAGVPDGPHRRTTGYRRTFVYPSVGVGFYPARRLYFAFAFMPPVAIFLSTAKEIWKRTPPKTVGFWISLSSNCNRGAKRFRTESPALLSPLPLLRPTRKLSSLAPYRGSALHPTYFYMLRPEGPHLSITACRKTPPAPASRV